MAKGSFDNFVGTLDGYAQRITKRVHYERLKIWKDILFKPKETLQKEKKNASVMRGAKDIAVVTLFEFGVFGLLLLLLAVILTLVIAAIGIPKGINGGAWGLLAIFVAVIVVCILAVTLFYIMSWLVTSAIEFSAARLLGGVGSFSEHAYLSALESAAFMTCYIPLSILLIIPFVGAVTYPISVLIGFYALYLKYLLIERVHKISKFRALAVMVAPTVLIMAVAIAIIVLVYTLMLAAAFSKK